MDVKVRRMHENRSLALCHVPEQIANQHSEQLVACKPADKFLESVSTEVIEHVYVTL